jgi:hypothetical protein
MDTRARPQDEGRSRKLSTHPSLPKQPSGRSRTVKSSIPPPSRSSRVEWCSWTRPVSVCSAPTSQCAKALTTCEAHHIPGLPEVL